MPSSPHSERLELRLDALVRTAQESRDRFLAWRRSRLGLRGALLYLLAAPLALAAVVSLAQGELGPAAAAGSAFALIWAGAFLNRRGMLEDLVAPERRFTRSWALPHKYLGAALVGAGTALAAYAAVGHSAAVSLTYGLLAVAGFHLGYRLPRPNFLVDRPAGSVRDRPLHKAMAQAEQRILAIEKAAVRIGNGELEQRLRRIAARGRAILDQIAARPGERFRARKFLNVYLEGAERVAGRYARTHRLARDRELEQNFRNVLAEIEAMFDRQLSHLAEHDIADLDVQIEVLRRQLEREGIT